MVMLMMMTSQVEIVAVGRLNNHTAMLIDRWWCGVILGQWLRGGSGSRVERAVRNAMGRFSHEIAMIAVPQRVLQILVLDVTRTQELVALRVRGARVRIDLEQDGPQLASLARLAAAFEDALLQLGQIHHATV